MGSLQGKKFRVDANQTIFSSYRIASTTLVLEIEFRVISKMIYLQGLCPFGGLFPSLWIVAKVFVQKRVLSSYSELVQQFL